MALWQVIARVIDQGSRLSAVRLAQVHAACDVLGIRQGFNEGHLYANLSWLSRNQKGIERRLFKARAKGKKPELFLYDVTSSYFEGEHNELADWGYNRDGKSAKEFGCKQVTFVGDRGMIKNGRIEQLNGAGFHYITAITKPQIEKLLREGVFQMELFDGDIYEVEEGGIRYILRRNPQRAEEIARTRQEKRESIEKLCRRKNEWLAQHPRAKVAKAVDEISKRIERLRISGWLKVKADGTRLELKEDEEDLMEEAMLDGCYVIKSDLPREVDKQIIHDRYKDLAEVEQAFRTLKTAMLQMRPWYVQTEESTRGHALVVMLAYLVTCYLQKAWAHLDLTVEEGLSQLTTLCSTKVVIKGQQPSASHRIPKPTGEIVKLFEGADVRLPQALPSLGANVVSRKSLKLRRRSN